MKNDTNSTINYEFTKWTLVRQLHGGKWDWADFDELGHPTYYGTQLEALQELVEHAETVNDGFQHNNCDAYQEDMTVVQVSVTFDRGYIPRLLKAIVLPLSDEDLTYTYPIAPIKTKDSELLVADLPSRCYMFGNKGAVWGDEAHIALSGDGTHRTLCGKPMLSTNHARLSKVKTIGCLKCKAEYEKLHWDVTSPDGFSIFREETPTTYKDAKIALDKFVEGFRTQGVYSTGQGDRILFDNIAEGCSIEPYRPTATQLEEYTRTNLDG